MPHVDPAGAGPTVIRDRRDDDLAALAEVVRRVHEHDGYPYVLPARPHDWLRPTGVVRALVGVDTDDRPQGHVLLVAVDSASWVSKLFTDPGARGTGLAAALLDAACRAAGGPVTLEVTDDSLAAIALYERVGWTLVDSRPALWTTPTGRHPILRYYRSPLPTPGPAG